MQNNIIYFLHNLFRVFDNFQLLYKEAFLKHITDYFSSIPKYMFIRTFHYRLTLSAGVGHSSPLRSCGISHRHAYPAGVAAFCSMCLAANRLFITYLFWPCPTINREKFDMIMQNGYFCRNLAD